MLNPPDPSEEDPVAGHDGPSLSAQTEISQIFRPFDAPLLRVFENIASSCCDEGHLIGLSLWT